ncbi:platelet-activating factor acetylhydrolase IB subunit alpha2-like [Babylonia areolata]|uniref:platelet-activating factor acetylhydrolase IB subunit alpha2-like n=1 Tax=Babylonia areolata TaxID=304850 RepID=UPI003FD139CA
MANPAANPQPVKDVQGDGRWMSQHNAFLMEGKEREPEVLFLGDSIFAHLGQTEIWKEMFEPLHCLNFSIGADQTQHLLWRILNGEMDNVEPKVIVLLIGTNNHDHSAEQVSEAIEKIVEVLTEKRPKAQLIVMGLLPRGEEPNPIRRKLAHINLKLEEKLCDLPNVTFLAVEPSLFYESGSETIGRQDMWDFVHLTKQGYQKMCEPLLEEIQSLLQNFVKVESTSVDTASMAGELASDRP